MNVLLAADVGNTEIVLGVFTDPAPAGPGSTDPGYADPASDDPVNDDQALVHTWRLSTQPERTADELALHLDGFLASRGIAFAGDVTAFVVASVVPDVTAALREMAERYLSFAPLVVGPGTRTGVPILTDNPREVGADRVVNALAAFTRYGGPSVVVDFGTGTNFDVVSERGEFLGGVIAPGLQISAQSLFARTARLTRVDLVPPRSPIGKGTVEAIQSGLIYGTAGEVDGIVDRIRGELDAPDAPVVATGGLAPVVIPHCRTVDHHEPFLTLEGLRLVHRRTEGAPDA